MINKTEFEILSILSENPEIDEGKYFDELKTLMSERLIEHNVTGQNLHSIFYHGFLITPKGQRAYEEYINFMKNENRNNETLNLSKKAIQKSRTANIISIISIVFSTIFSALAFAFSIWKHFNN